MERIVYLSFISAAPDATFTFARDHFHTEQHILASGLAFTFSRQNLYMDLVPLLAGEDGVIRGPAGTAGSPRCCATTSPTRSWRC